MTLLRRRLLRVASLSTFALSASALWVMEEHRRDQTSPDSTFDANPVTLVGSPVPSISLPAVGPGPTLETTDIAGAGGPVLLNFFASWCAPCLAELPALLGLRQRGLAIWGIAYRDRPADTVAFLRAHGNPYQRVGHDYDGVLGPKFDLAGLPESFLVSTDGVVRWGWAGELTQPVIDQSVVPLLTRH